MHRLYDTIDDLHWKTDR